MHGIAVVGSVRDLAQRNRAIAARVIVDHGDDVGVHQLVLAQILVQLSRPSRAGGVEELDAAARWAMASACQGGSGTGPLCGSDARPAGDCGQAQVPGEAPFTPPWAA
jgi:hypothetical protein